MDYNKPVDLLMHVGEQFYSLGDAVREYSVNGVSKRISTTAIPQGIKPGRSRLFLIHPKAIVFTSRSLRDLARELQKRKVLQVDPDDYPDGPFDPQNTPLEPSEHIPIGLLALAVALSALPEKERVELEHLFELSYHPGVFGYTYLGKIQYVVRDGEESLPEDLRDSKDVIEPVKVTYVEEEEHGA